MLDLSIIDSPSHYVTGRRIEPICVIEDWKLDHNHYLACVVKYIARAGRKNPIQGRMVSGSLIVKRKY